MNVYRELLIGCGSRREKDRRLPSADIIRWHQQDPGRMPAVKNYQAPGNEYEFKNLVTLDINPDHRPDILFNLERIDGETCNHIPNKNTQVIDGIYKSPCNTGTCPDEHYDEIHAYEVLEHIGRQGDYRKFFYQFSEFWRILKQDGFLFATVPMWNSEWAWGDPSHTRVITPGSLVFLSQRQYREQIGKTPMSDFRFCYQADFETVYCREDNGALCFVLQAIK